MSDDYDWTRDHDWIGDPEVEADLRKRSASERDPSRTRTAVSPMGGSVVTAWPCAATGCTETVLVTEDAVFTLDVFNAELEKRGEAPIAPAAFCPPHAAQRNRVGANALEGRRDETRELVRQVRNSSNAHGEVAAIARLRRLGHPDVDGLLQALAEKPGRRRRGSV